MSTDSKEVVQEAQQVEAEARRMGWKPKEEFRRPPEDWLDARTFVERGKEILPIVRSRLERAEVENQTLRDRLAAAETRAVEQQGQIDGLKQFSTEVAQQQRERVRAELLAELSAAREKNDVVAEAAVLDKLADTRAKPAAAAKPNGNGAAASTAAPAPRPQDTPVFQAWLRENDWFEKDPVMRAAALEISAQMGKSGELEGVDQQGRLDLLARETLKRFHAPAPPAARSRVEGGGRPAAATETTSTEDATYDNLSADAKAACDGQASRLNLVGEGKAFKTLAEWRAHYAKMVA